MSLVEQDHSTHDLDDVESGDLRQLIGNGKTIHRAVGVDSRFDQFVVRQGLHDLFHHARGYAALPDLHDG